MAPTTTDLAICREFKDSLSASVPLIRLALFGSRARGDKAPESDFDFLVEIARTDRELRRQVRRIAWEIAFRHNTVFHTVIVSHEQVVQGPERASLLLQAVRQEGVAI
jgi:predicted nucleotidyltransferase